MGVLVKIAERFEKLFERSVDKQDPDAVEQDAQKTGQEESVRAGDAAVDNAKTHVVHDLRTLGIKSVPKLAWLKFTLAVTAVFSGIFGYVVTRPPTPEQQAAQEIIQRDRIQQQQIEYLNKIVISQAEMNKMIDGIFVQDAPVPVPDTPAVPAAAAPYFPPAIAAVAAEPITVEVTTNSGEHTEKQSTVGQVYLQAPAPVRQRMEQPAPEPFHIDHGYDHENPNDCFHTDCLNQHRNENRGGSGFHKDFTVSSEFASVHIHN